MSKHNTPTTEQQLDLPLPPEPHLEQGELFDFPGQFQCVRGKLQLIPAERGSRRGTGAGSAVQFLAVDQDPMRFLKKGVAS